MVESSSVVEGAVENRGLYRAFVLHLFTVRAEMITELILKRAGPVIFKTFLLELIAFRPIPVICPARGVSLKITGNDN